MKNTQYVYPAQFIREDNNSISVYFPDLDGCQTYDDTLSGAAIMAKKALEDYIETLLEMKLVLPSASRFEDVTSENCVVMFVVADVRDVAA